MTRRPARSLDDTLTYARAAALLRYDPGLGALYWRAGKRAGKRADTNGWERYRRVQIDGVRYLAHRVIWLLRTRAWPRKGAIDHRDGDGHNNRWGNLREATAVENRYNTGPLSSSRSGLKWVRTKRDGSYQATVQLYLGTFDTARAAHEVARRFVARHHGQFFNPGRTLGAAKTERRL